MGILRCFLDISVCPKFESNTRFIALPSNFRLSTIFGFTHLKIFKLTGFLNYNLSSNIADQDRGFRSWSENLL